MLIRRYYIKLLLNHYYHVIIPVPIYCTLSASGARDRKTPPTGRAVVSKAHFAYFT